MRDLHVIVSNKVATYLSRDGSIVCGNSNYRIVFTFDSEWDAHNEKVARFIWNDKYYDVPFTGNTVAVPVLNNTRQLKVGVYAGEICTTTPAVIDCQLSILCGTTDEIPLIPSQYEEVMARLDELEQNGGGLTDTASALLISILRNGVYTTDQSANITALEAALASSGGGSGDGDSGETEKTLTSISATYSGGDVAAGTALADLTGVVVTAHYSDGTSATVTGYTLSGTIAEGSNTITVSYGGKTTTFTVTGTASSGNAELNTDGLLGFFDLRNKAAGSGNGSTGYYDVATVGDGRLYSWQVSPAGNEYGAYLIGKTFCVGASFTAHDFGTEYTWIFKAYCDKQYTLPGETAHMAFNGNMGNTIAPKYNTSDGATNATSQVHGKVPAGYHTVAIKVSASKFYFYVDAELFAEWDGADIDGFVSWYSKVITREIFTSGQTVLVYAAMAFYDRALTEVEIVEMNEYLKTLEVA